MKLSLVLAAGPVFGCAAAAPPPAVAPIEPTPVTTTTAVCAASEAPAPRVVEPVPVNVTVTPPMKVVDPELLAAAKRLPLQVLTLNVSEVTTLRTIEGKLRLHGKIGFHQTEITLPPLTSQCEAIVLSAIQTHAVVTVSGKGRSVADMVPGHGYVNAVTLEDVQACR